MSSSEATLEANAAGRRPPSMWQLFMLVLCVYVLVALFIDTVFDIPAETSRLLIQIDNAICFIFLGDFFYNLYAAESKKAYMKWGWIDFVSSIPFLTFLRWGRVFRLARLMRLLRGVRSLRHLMSYLFRERARSTLLTAFAASVLIMVFAAIAITRVEPSVSAGDGFWWSAFTLVMSEYGEIYPRTIEGKLIALLLITSGGALFGTFAATLAATFLKPEEEEDIRRDKEIMEEVQALRREVEDLRDEIGRRGGR